ncbi:MAG TPA: cytochrome c oxidase assembly protein [Myxococcota bacterium]|nr:cytochrome c oxidase assembly protein [Myxococcota bacterium]
MRALLLLPAGLLASREALAHEALGRTWWTLDPFVVAGFALLLLVRPRIAWSFGLAVAALFLALVWPLDALAGESLAAHMAQHMLLIAIAAPLLVYARPAMPALSALPRFALAALRIRPRTAFLAHGAAIWLGHAPPVILWAVEHRGFHVLGHAVLLGTALVFCQALARRGRHGEGALWILATMIHTGALGALLTFAPRPLYPGYSLEDQQLAGLVMWVPGGICYLVIGLAYAAAMLRTRAVALGQRPSDRATTS